MNKRVKYIVLLSYADDSDEFSREEVEVDELSDKLTEHGLAIEAAKRQKYIGATPYETDDNDIMFFTREYRVFGCFPEWMLKDIVYSLSPRS